MPIIRPVSDLRNNFVQISKIVHEEDQPIFLTKNGVGDMVVMSLSYYERYLSQFDLYERLQSIQSEVNSADSNDKKPVNSGTKAKTN